ncbi:MAG: hypothetical protein HYZ54_06770 [Ignavibacteriae bacterium]|nr:hypothetical protein [Ignavibacteriota bacterium]
MNHILIFKTNIHSPIDMEAIAPHLDSPHIIRWSVDREDIDRVLRIEATHDASTEIINTIQKAGYLCEELL